MDQGDTTTPAEEKSSAKKQPGRGRRRSLPVASLMTVLVCGLLGAWVIQQTDRISTTAEDLESVHKFILVTAETRAQLFEFQKPQDQQSTSAHQKQQSRGQQQDAGTADTASMSVHDKQAILNRRHSGLLPIAGEHTGPGTAFPHAPRGRWLQTRAGQPFVWKADP